MDTHATAATASTDQATMESVLKAMEAFRAIKSEHVPRGSVFLMNPVDFRWPKMEIGFDPAPERDFTVRAMAYDVPLTPPRSILLNSFNWDDVVGPIRKRRESVRWPILVAVVAAITVFLLTVL